MVTVRCAHRVVPPGVGLTTQVTGCCVIDVTVEGWVPRCPLVIGKIIPLWATAFGAHRVTQPTSIRGMQIRILDRLIL